MTVNRSIVPNPVGEIKFHLPNINIYKLENGVELIFVKKTDLPIIKINALFNCGAKFDGNRNGLAALTSFLIDEGADGLSALEIDDEIEQLGSAIEISTNHDSFILELISMSDTFSQSLQILSKIITNPNFDEKDFQREKSKLENRLNQLKDVADYQASKFFNKIIFENTEYGHPSLGNIQSLNTICNSDVKKFYNNHFGKNNLTLIAVGNIEDDHLLDLLNSTLGKWEKESNLLTFNSKTKTTSKKLYIVNKEDAPQSEIRIGHISSNRYDGNYFSKLVANNIFGGQFTSRINLNLREKRGITYGASSAFVYNKTFGQFSVGTSVQAEHTKIAVTEILDEMKNFDSSIKESEVEFAKSYLTKRYPSMFETFSQIAKNITSLSLFELENSFFNTYLENLSNVSLASVQKAANKNILFERAQIVIVGNCKLLKSQFKDWEIIELTI